MTTLLFEHGVPEEYVPAHWLIGAKTRMVDTWTPQLEMLRLPPIREKAGRIRVLAEEGTSRCDRRAAWLEPKPFPIDTPVLDLRFDGNDNIAHTLHRMALYAVLCEQVASKRGLAKPTVVMRKGAKPYCLEAMRLFGAEVLCTNRPVMGKLWRVECDGHLTELRLGDRYLRPLLDLEPRPQDPTKVYLSRRGARSVTNDDDGQAFLAEKGYQTLHLEDLPVAAQIRTVVNATHIVAIHGAATAALTLRCPIQRTPLAMTEVFGSYIVSGNRMVVHRIGGSWAGVRGVLNPKATRNEQRGGPPRAYQAAPFEVDLDALDCALQCSASDGVLPEKEWILG